MFEGEHGRPVPSDSTVTRSVIDAAWGNVARGGDRPALVDPGRRLGLARFATLVPAAATGLRRHGMRPGDVAAVHLTGVGDLALAVHAVAAAGAVPAPLPHDASVGELAAMMIESGARFLFTGGDTAAASLAATERSYVRQVFAFGDVPDATPFARLVDSGTAGGSVTAPAGPAPVPGWSPSTHAPSPTPVRDPAMAQAGGPGGTACYLAVDPLREPALRLCAPAEEITHADRLADLHRLRESVALTGGDVLVCAADDCAAPIRIGLVDLCLIQGATMVGVPDPGIGALLAAVHRHHATHAVITPAKLRLLADLDTVPVPGVRLLVTGSPDPDVVQACRVRHGWAVSVF